MIRDNSPSFKVELLRDWVFVLLENILTMVLVVGVSPGHGYCEESGGGSVWVPTS